jgi:putative peptidoglycan lipid II flippase
VYQINVLVGTILASWLPQGGVSWLYYADRLMEFPSGVLGATIATILLPSLSKHYSEGSSVEYSKLLDWGLRLIVVITLPAALALGMVAVPLLATFFQYGAFTAHDVLMTRNALVGYSVGLIGILSVKVLAPGFYARQDIKTPVKVGIVTLFATQAMNLLFIGSLQHAGLALAIGLGACLNSAILFYLLRKREIYKPEPGWAKFLAKVGLAMLVLGLTLWLGMGSEQSWLSDSGWGRVWRMTGLVAMGMAAYIAVLWLLGFRLKDFSRREA